MGLELSDKVFLTFAYDWNYTHGNANFRLKWCVARS